MTRSSDAAVAERYRLLLELSPDAIAVHQDGLIVYVNSAALDFARLTDRDEMLGRPITDFVHPDELPHMIERIVSMGDEAGAATYPEEVVMVDAHGVSRPMEVTSVRTVWHDKPAYQVILRDITAQKAIDAALRRQAALLDHVSNAVIAVDTSMTVRSWNPAAEQLYGITAGDAVGRELGSVAGGNLDVQAAVALGGTVDQLHRRADNDRTFLAHISVTSMDDGFLIVAEPTRRPLIERLGTILAALHQAVIVVRADGGIELANPAAATMLGPQAVPGSFVHDLPLDFVDGESPIVRCLRTRTAVTDATATINTPGGERWLSCSCRPIDDDTSEAVVLVSFADITERYRERTRLAWDAVHDPLTRLYNRAGILKELESHMDALGDHDTDCVAIYYIDLDNFKLVNDSLGHAVGDEVLHTVAQRLAGATPGKGAVGRIGGDEFVLVTTHPKADTTAEIDRQIESIRAAIRPPVSVTDRSEPLTVRVSIGVATVAAGDRSTPADLLRDADIALYQARKASREPYVRFRTHHREELQRRQRIEEELRRALASDPSQLEIHYQPIVSTESGTLVALEALLRWNHPDLGAIPPAEFIPLAEQSTLIDKVGTHVLATACAEVAGAPQLRQVMLCVNASRRELTNEEFLRRLRDTCSQTGMNPRSLCLEITESALAPLESGLLNLLVDIRALGISISLDDFGTGASSLSELYRLPVGILKTAKAFVDALGENPNARTILAGIVDVAHAVGVRVIAEGVETADQAATIAAVGCDLAQGFHYGRPMPLAEILTGSPAISAMSEPPDDARPADPDQIDTDACSDVRRPASPPE
ncbi:sensor domain-containing protein [Gordonia rubripertincta]|uniref:EAL domain-containing protein n=1 Tax=Gordonia rubripertincta TaxID=36822 RepID=A0AAW6RAL3_GORRU|nr:EAL domain-containing protein [Gordonia rubripertincta]MDG6783307.1 EAL domain-containing protein [Gordonia rubripertincta]